MVERRFFLFFLGASFVLELKDVTVRELPELANFAC